MQEPPNESDASVSTLIIVFGSYALYSLSSTFTCTVYLYRLDTDIGSKYTDKSAEITRTYNIRIL